MSFSGNVVPSQPGDQDRAGRLITIYWVQMFSAVLLISCRMHARSLKPNYGWDDALMVLTLVMQLILAGLVTKYALIGGTRHLRYLTPAQASEAIKWSFLIECWGLLAYVPAKASVAWLIYRIMRPFRGWRFWTLVVSIVLLAVQSVLEAVVSYVQCDPPAALWDKSITNAKCWPPSYQARTGIAQASFGVFVDVLLAVIPATLIYKLKLPRNQKIALMILLGLGLNAAVAGIVKITLLVRLTERSDLTWHLYDLIVWAGTENWVVLMCGSIPPLTAYRWGTVTARVQLKSSKLLVRGCDEDSTPSKSDGGDLLDLEQNSRSTLVSLPTN